MQESVAQLKLKPKRLKMLIESRKEGSDQIWELKMEFEIWKAFGNLSITFCSNIPSIQVGLER